MVTYSYLVGGALWTVEGMQRDLMTIVVKSFFEEAQICGSVVCAVNRTVISSYS